MIWREIGKYLDKQVRFAHVTSVVEYLSDQSLQHTLLIIYFSDESINSQKLTQFFKQMAIDLPLSIVISGQNAMIIFDQLLEILSGITSKEHIMTNVFETENIHNLIEDFLNATWPAAERHRTWEHYSFLQIGQVSIEQIFITEMKKLKYAP
ncbi:hypothetical protein FH581_022695 (plasmid) [Leptospira weilii]|uniref:hypothetical protein n=1 Tax=Leptospira weilii TaxID=28184 RepID=UPI00201B78E2|nr:hypothetical protein [Leptospira weilii]UPY81065.1 hypothetical protein FH581_022695 [Leptospira weilii]